MHPGWDEFLEKVKLQLAETFLQEKDENKQKKYIQINTPSYLYCRVQRDKKKKRILSGEYMRNNGITREKIKFRLLNLRPLIMARFFVDSTHRQKITNPLKILAK